MNIVKCSFFPADYKIGEILLENTLRKKDLVKLCIPSGGEDTVTPLFK